MRVDRRVIKSAFVTFEKRSQKEAYLKILPNSRLRMLCCSAKFRIAGKPFYVKDPPDPININWKNYNRTRGAKLVRRLVSGAVFLSSFFIRKRGFNGFSVVVDVVLFEVEGSI